MKETWEYIDLLICAKACANEYQITEAFLHTQMTNKAFQLSEKQLQLFADLSRPSDAAKNNKAKTLLPFAKEPAARTEFTFAHVDDAPLRIYKNDYDQPPVSHSPRANCVIRGEEWDESVREAREKGWAGQRYLGALKASPSKAKNTSLSTDDQPSMDNKGP